MWKNIKSALINKNFRVSRARSNKQGSRPSPTFKGNLQAKAMIKGRLGSN